MPGNKEIKLSLWHLKNKILVHLSDPLYSQATQLLTMLLYFKFAKKQVFYLPVHRNISPTYKNYTNGEEILADKCSCAKNLN